jgi:hypothetical protein
MQDQVNDVMGFAAAVCVLGFFGAMMSTMTKTSLSSEHHSMWLTPEQRKDLEKKYGAVATRWGEEMAPVGDIKAAESAASRFWTKMKEVIGI